MRFLLLLALLIGAPTRAQQPSAPACADPAYDHLDFWLGTWDLTWEGGQGGTPEGETGHGVNTVTAAYGNCVIREAFESAGGYDGGSVSIYDARAGQWRQTWVDNQGGHIAFTGGLTDDGQMEFRTAPFTTPQGDEQMSRMIWTDAAADALTWRWQASTDGGATWTDRWVIRYARR